jgi:aldose sugar dehydrogenase
MKKGTFIIIIIIGILAVVYFGQNDNESDVQNITILPPPPSGEQNELSEIDEIIAEDLEIPWDIAFLSNGDFLVTERPGRLQLITSSGNRTEILVSGVKTGGEGGLLGIVLHPNFDTNNYLYLYLSATGIGGKTINRVERYVFEQNTLTQKKTIITNIPGAPYHDGGRMEFGPDGMLYITTGDATESRLAQDKNSLAGKILRIYDDGTIPRDNPFNNEIYSYGHRNPQGIAWDDRGNLWSTEHGRSGIHSGLDEINLIQKGGNYGWPDSEGDTVRAGTIAPALHSGPTVTWAPASLIFYNGNLYFGGLRGEGLYEALLQKSTITQLNKYFDKEYGRIRTVRSGPDGNLYILTSNRDGRGDIMAGDDKLIRINTQLLN